MVLFYGMDTEDYRHIENHLQNIKVNLHYAKLMSFSWK